MNIRIRHEQTDGLISVITPTRNYGRFLGAALASVRGQGAGVEHIVVDGGSSDDTLEQLTAFSSPTLRWISEPDEGQSDALNKGRRLAEGEWIAWLNADEFYFPWTVQHWRTAIKKHPDADVIFGDVVWVDGEGRTLRLLPQHGFDHRLMRWYGCYVATCTTLVRASALPDPFLDTALRRWMDWDLWMRMARDGHRFVHLRSPLGAFAVHEAAVTFADAGLRDPELTQIRRQHRIPAGGAAPLALRSAARADHIVRKVLNGGYVKQARTAALKHRRLHWWETAADMAAAQRLHDSTCSVCDSGSAT